MKMSVLQADIQDSTVLLRVDYNVPFLGNTGEISDDSRIRASIPTIDYLLSKNCKIIICSHVGRPKGERVESLRMQPISTRLSELIELDVKQVDDCVGKQIEIITDESPPASIIMLENLRFHTEEEANDQNFAEALSRLASIYVNDAFGTSHRAHASIEGITHFLPSVSGLLLDKEITVLQNVLEQPSHPYVAILGGAKVSDKISVARHLAERVDLLVIGGGMINPFLRVQGYSLGEVQIPNEELSFASEILNQFEKGKFDLKLPVDVVVSDSLSSEAPYKTVPLGDIPVGWHIMDIGAKSSEEFRASIIKAKTVIWNGPMGIFEMEQFSKGTLGIAKTLSQMIDAMTVIGGGSTAEAVKKLGLDQLMTHVSTGGGACLKFLEGNDLPGVVALMDAS